MTLVVDASVVAAALIDTGPTGIWAEAVLIDSDHLVAPHLIQPEVANVLRRAAGRGWITGVEAEMAHNSLRDLPLELWPYDAVADRVWELRENLSSYDACYVALAELLGASLATADRRLAAAPGLLCDVVVAPTV